MSLEQEKPTNNFEQPLSTGVEGFEVSKGAAETTPITPEVTVAELAELAIEPVVETVKEAPISNPITEAQVLGEKTLDLFNITEKNVDGEAGNAQKITNKLNDYKAAA